ncbi:MAG TPA: DUF6259 domain-containing protein [Candidatus Sulfotelmatobacter sp.]|nr:DUF6259 domain-containing protein [Candidatus Sulfotelmatobacter sp.]
MKIAKAFSSLCASMVAMLVLISVSVGQTLPSPEVILQDSKLLVAFDSHSGALLRLEDKSSHWIIERRPELGISFRLHAPLANRRDNFVLGEKQVAAEVKKVSESRVLLRWSNLLSEHGGRLPITVTATVSLENGALTFAASIANRSLLSIETIDYPYFGDLNSPSRDTPMQVRTMWYANLQSDEIYPVFRNEKGYWGDFYPTKTFDSSRSLFCLVQTPSEGLYVEMADPSQRYFLQYTFEQHPGVVDSISETVPHQDEIDQHQVRLQFRATHFIFAHPHSSVKLAPIVLRVYQGDWHAGVDLYKQWRTTWFKNPPMPKWIQDIHSWQQLQINSPEQDYRVPYADLLKYGEECARDGVKAIQLVGWNRGGQDGGDPAQDTDPSLGTWQQLHDAIAKIQSMGVKIILFGKLNWADKTTPWYQTQLFKYATQDPYGIEYEQGGYSYYTPTQLAGINNHRRAVMDFLSPAYQEVATKEFQKLLSLGAAGWLFDENCHHGPVKYNFAKNHGYEPPGYIYGGDMPMAARLRAAANKVDHNFIFAGEGPQDWLMQYYPISYFRINANSTPVARYIDPHAPLIVAVTGFDDREMLNLILLNRYIISYEPYNFKGFLSDYVLTLTYGQKIDALRRKYKEWLWDADFRDTLGASISADGASKYSVFVAKTGKRAVVIVNQEHEKAITVRIDLPNPGPLLIATPERQDAQAMSDTVQIPPRSAAAVMER